MDIRLLLDCDGETAARAIAETLARRKLRVVRSFDLRVAMAAHADCECPDHGTVRCNCQFVVLLVYAEPSTGSRGAPVVVTAHSRDARAQVHVVRGAGSWPDRRLAKQVVIALLEVASSYQAASSRQTR